MSSRLLTVFMCLVFAGCNLILPATPGDEVQEADGGVDGYRPQKDGSTSDIAEKPDWVLRSDTPGRGDLQFPRDVFTDQSVVDGGAEVFIPPLWECQTPMELLSPSVETGSFTRFAQQAEENFIYIYYNLCGVDTPVSGPERGWFLQVDQVAFLGVQVTCEGPCWAYLMKDGCNYQNTEACWNPHETPTFTWDLLPGTWYVAVEHMEIEGTPAAPGWVSPPFDIHAALNRTHGHPGCVEDGSLSFSTILAEGSCEAVDGKTWRVWTRHGDLPAPGAGPDRAWLPCIAGATLVDPIGGMPEYILRLDADVPGEARKVDMTATLDPGVATGLPGWAAILGLAAPPCGATSSLVDCDGGLKKTLQVPDVTLLPGQEAFLYLDGVGGEAMDGPAERPYRLDIRLEAACTP